MVASHSFPASTRASDEYIVLQPPTIWFCFLTYIALELVFYFTFHFYLKPRANDLKTKTIKPYRDYGKKRHLLFERILNRMEKKCKLENKDMDSEFHDFLRRWFYGPSASNTLDTTDLTPSSTPSSKLAKSQEKKLFSPRSHTSLQRQSTSASSSECSLEGTKEDAAANNDNQAEQNGCELFYKEDLTEFFTWAFFDKRHSDINDSWEKEELNKMFHMLESRYGFVYQTYEEARKNQQSKMLPIMSRMKPRCMTLEKCNPLHRPFALYATFSIMRLIGYLLLLWKGFRRYHICIPCNGRRDKYLYYWFRGQKPSNGTLDNRSDPILFFHGIAPAGLTFYLPMLFHTFIKKGFNSRNKYSQRENPIFLFENLPITCSLVFDALTEDETVEGVDAILGHHGFISSQETNESADLKKLILCGHSFGSFQLTWLLKSPVIKKRIKKIILLDPVSILLSEPDVITNFLYNKGAETIFDQSHNEEYTFIECMNRVVIRVFASSELGIEYHLRRHFAWYNSELWLEDVPKSVDLSVYFAEKDEIIDAEKVKKEIERFRNIKFTQWNGLGHGAIITKSELWFHVSNEIECTSDPNNKKMN